MRTLSWYRGEKVVISGMDYTPVISAVKKQRQEGLSKFKTSQDYIVKPY